MLLNIIERYVVLAEPLVCRAVALVAEVAVEKQQSYKSPFIYKVPVRILQSGCKTVLFKFPKLLTFM
jgi:hypothetical protein